MTIERLNTHETPQEPSQWTTLMLAGINFGRYFSLSSGSVRRNFDRNGISAFQSSEIVYHCFPMDIHKMVEHLSKSSGAAQHSKSLAYLD